ncbi:hypothetical protein SUGI_0444690 [Cryptomeria japonica]|nr:hypothetical protein SUGI_0444690 [Cryptomeria japonica]
MAVARLVRVERRCQRGQTKLADEINSRKTITVLALNNAAMASLTSLPLSEIKRTLSLHVVLDFFNPTKLHDISNGTTLTTTLYQTTGNAPGNSGFVNITDLSGGKVGFGTAAKGTKLDATYVKSVAEEGYNISVLEISQPITTSVAEAPAPSPSQANITALLVKGGCKIFAGMLASTGAMKTFEDNAEGGLTVFAPSDAAFTPAVMKMLKNLTADDQVSLLLYHGLPTYSPLGTLKTTNGHLNTLATGGGAKYALTVTTAGDTVTLSTGVDKGIVASTIIDNQPIVVFTVNKVLLPTDLFSPAPAPAPAPEADVPATSPEASSPPAPAGPSDSPSASAAHSPAAAAKSEKSAAVVTASCQTSVFVVLALVAGTLHLYN